MFGSDSERILLSLGPDVTVIFDIKKCNSGFVRMSLEDDKKIRKNILNVICVALLASYLNCALIVRVTE